MEQGLESFNPDGEREASEICAPPEQRGFIWSGWGGSSKALRIVDEVWPELGSIDQVETVLSFYWLRSDSAEAEAVSWMKR